MTHYKCLSRTVICTERLQLFLRKYFLPPTLQEHLALLLSASCQMGHLAAGGESARGASSSCLTLTAPLARLTLATSQEMHPTAAGPMSRTLPVRVRYMDMFKTWGVWKGHILDYQLGKSYKRNVKYESKVVELGFPRKPFLALALSWFTWQVFKLLLYPQLTCFRELLAAAFPLFLC